MLKSRVNSDKAVSDTLSGWPSFGNDEIRAVSKVLKTGRVNYWTGSGCREFEKEFSLWCGTKYAVSLANGTLALEAALQALKIGVGDEVVVSPRTFFASVSCIVKVGATPVFADVDRDSQNITAESIRPVITSRTKAVICVHLAGWPCEMDPILSLAREFDLKVIEDCAQAHGAMYKGRMVGSLGDVAAWSFCQDKIMTTGGEGGMITTNDKWVWSRVWSLKDHGKSWEAMHEARHPSGFRWVHDSFGSNWRMMEVQAAIGRLQLKKVSGWVGKRRANARRIMEACSKSKLFRDHVVPEHIHHSYYKFYAFIKPERLASGWSRQRIVEVLNRKGVLCYYGSCPEVYLEKAFDNTGFRPRHPLPNAHYLGKNSLMFLVHPTLKKNEMDKICSIIRKVCDQASNEK